MSNNSQTDTTSTRPQMGDELRRASVERHTIAMSAEGAAKALRLLEQAQELMGRAADELASMSRVRASLPQRTAGSTGEIAPTEAGAFKGDIWFGHPEKRNMGTHRWNGESWEILPDEIDGLLVLLANAREDIVSLKAAASTPAQSVLVESIAMPGCGAPFCKHVMAPHPNCHLCTEEMERAPSQPAPVVAPSMTDLMVTPESIDLHLLREACDWPQDLTFKFLDDPGEHDPCYVIMPGGAMLPFAHHDKNGVDQARAQFIVDACNEKIASNG